MKVTFLGTGTSQGVPVIACRCMVCRSENEKDRRLRSSVMFEVEGKTLVVDCGPDFRQQMLRVHAGALDAILLTHAHKDHTGGLDDVRAFNFNLRKEMPVFADRLTQEIVKKQYDYVFEPNPYPGIPRVVLHEIDERPFMAEGVEVIPVRVYHHKLPVLGFRVKDFTYITDANHIPPEEKEKIKGSKVLVLNALRKQEHISHFTLDEAVALVKELKPEQAYFTHISHQLGLHEEVNKSLPSNIALAYDGLTVELPD